MSDIIPVRRNKKNRILTVEAFDRLLDCLGPDRDQAAIKYEELRSSLIGFFAMHGTVDPNELADETFNRVAYRLAEGQIITSNNPAYYFLAVARNVWREQLARPFKVVTLTEFSDHLPTHEVSPEELLIKIEQGAQTEEQLDCLASCILRLPEIDRMLLTQYHQSHVPANSKNRQALAQQFGVTLGSLRNRISRIRDRMATCTEECLSKKDKV